MAHPELNSIRTAFLQRVAAPSIPHAAFKLAWLLAFKYMNRETQTARPAQATLAHDLNVSIRTVQRLLDILEPLGLIIVPGDGRGLASTYCIDAERATRVSSFSAEKGDKKGRQPAPKRVTPVSPQPRRRTKKSPSEGLSGPSEGWRERVRTSCENISLPAGTRRSRGTPPKKVSALATPQQEPNHLLRGERKNRRERKMDTRLRPPGQRQSGARLKRSGSRQEATVLLLKVGANVQDHP